MDLSLRLSRTQQLAAVTLVVVVGLAACTTMATPSPSFPTGAASPGAGGVIPVDSGPPLAVIGTENFYADLLIQIGGSRVRATSFLNDPNADPHAFESSPRDAALVADASLVIVNGLGYDDFMQKLLGASTKPNRDVIKIGRAHV